MNSIYLNIARKKDDLNKIKESCYSWTMLLHLIFRSAKEKKTNLTSEEVAEKI